jgi:hypothetical protein
MDAKNCIFTVGVVAGIIIGLVLIPFGLLLGVQVTAQQQTMQAEDHHPNSGNNQSSISSTAEQRQNTTAGGGEMMFINQTFTTRWMSLVDGVKVTGISIIDNEHIAVNLSYDGEGEPPGVSVVAIANSSSDTIIGSMMQNPTSTNNSSIPIPILSMQSGSNYLEAGWQVQHPNSATVLVQLDGDMPEGGYIMVIVVPFLHR